MRLSRKNCSGAALAAALLILAPVTAARAQSAGGPEPVWQLVSRSGSVVECNPGGHNLKFPRPNEAHYMVSKYGGRAPSYGCQKGGGGGPVAGSGRCGSWQYSGAVNGQFTPSRDQPGVWVEMNTQATYYFREVARDRNYVELYDRSRDITVRLYSNVCFIRGPGAGGQFRYLYDGHWQ